MTEESGGEEILYPRKMPTIDLSKQPLPLEPLKSHAESPLSPLSERSPVDPDFIAQTSPPSAFAPLRKANKRTSEEFETDNAGTLVSKSSGNQKEADGKASTRKHRSLGGGSASSSTTTPRERGKERRRDTIGLSTSVTPKVGTTGRLDRHIRQTSASSSSSSHAEALMVPRRVHTTDFSHLPPSPSSSSIQHFLHHAAGNTAAGRPSSRDALHSSPNVVHSLLRGTQEGWSGLDDEATEEVLRKLDGISGKSARARASVGSFSRSTSMSRPSSISRPGTPARAGSTVQWEGIEGNKSSRRGRESIANKKDKDLEEVPAVPVSVGPLTGDLLQEREPFGTAITSSDDQLSFSHSSADRTPKKPGPTSARSSFTTKRSSASSTNYTSTPTTTSSRDSTQLSSTTSATSASAPSGRQSSGKNRRNSAGSDISNAYSSDATSLRDRATGEIPEDETVPPVPPLPKDLSSYKSPPHSSTSLAFPSLGEETNKPYSHESDLDRAVLLEVPLRQSSKPTSNLTFSNYRNSEQYSPITSAPEVPSTNRTPSKKWSFSSALNIKLSSSPSSASLKDSPGLKSSSFPLSPRSVTFGQRKSLSKDHVPSPSTASPKESWSPIQSNAMASAASLASLSSVDSGRPPRYPSKTPDRPPSRTGTESSASNRTTSALAVPQQTPLSPNSSVRRGQSQKRLTPSSIPFFRRSSSQSMHVSTSAAFPSSDSPTLSSAQTWNVKARSSPKDLTSPSQYTTGYAQKKSSVLSLGLPSLLKGSSSRRSLHGDKSDSKDSLMERQRSKDGDKSEKGLAKDNAKLLKERQKKEDKDRSESRISVMMGRKRGKVKFIEFTDLHTKYLYRLYLQLNQRR